jgi:glucose-6-phosphate 1-dehydrogenase
VVVAVEPQAHLLALLLVVAAEPQVEFQAAQQVAQVVAVAVALAQVDIKVQTAESQHQPTQEVVAVEPLKQAE